MSSRHLFTSESVTEGHPDKVSDGISDCVVDASMSGDKHSRVACETMVTTGMAIISGEITSTTSVNYPDIARDKIKRIGYTDAEMGFSYDTCAVLVSLDRQSPDISQGVTAGEGLYKEQGAGDQGMMFGYACDETRELMPMPIMFAHRLTRELARARKKGVVPYLRPDGKSQVSVVYEDGRPLRVDTVVLSTQHDPSVSHAKLKRELTEVIIRTIIPAKLLSSRTRFLVNPTGRFVVGGPQGDCGLTGRKIIVDTYGGTGRHGGGAFSGKDPSKVDRSAAYMCRYIAKNIVAAKLAKRCEVNLAYAIGYPEPVSVYVKTFGTGKVDDRRIEKAVKEVFGLRPAQIIKNLKLLRPVYEATSAYGHFGRTRNLDVYTWERTDRKDALASAV